MKFGFNLVEGEAASALAGLRPILEGLDRLLEAAVEITRNLWQTDVASERFRGLYIGQAEIDRILQRPAGEPRFSAAEFLLANARENSRSKALQEALGLSAFDFAVLMIALAPEIDLRYERLYAYLQDDVTRKRPSIDLVLNLLCSSGEEKMLRRRHFAADAPLVRQKIVRLFPDPNHAQPPRLAYCIKLDEQIVRLLLGQEGTDERLMRFCSLVHGDRRLEDAQSDEEVTAILRSMLSLPLEKQAGLILHFRGSSKVQIREAATAATFERGFRLLRADLAAVSDSAGLEETIELAVREARFRDAIPYLEGIASLKPDILEAAIELSRGIVFVASDPGVRLHVTGRRVIHLDFLPLNSNQRRACWERSLSQGSVVIDEPTSRVLASRFRLTPEQIGEAAQEACERAYWRCAMQSAAPIADTQAQVLAEDLYAAARAQSGPDLAAVARKLNPNYTWDDLVLPSDTLTQLQEICDRVAHRDHVMGEWGFGRKLSLGKGTTALFAGPTGTGKTMAAEVIANEVKLDLYKIDLAGVVSKYIGETEKNLDRIFAAAEDTNAILFFDEADALFGKRSEVRDSHDRYANIEISYLLQKMEAYEGTAILASNLRHHLDDSFIRRLAFNVIFPFPEADNRARIWRGIWPLETPLGEDINFELLASRFKLSGGNIKNVALAAAYLAAADGGSVERAHIFRAIEREFQKMGKSVCAEEMVEELEEVGGP